MHHAVFADALALCDNTSYDKKRNRKLEMDSCGTADPYLGGNADLFFGCSDGSSVHEISVHEISIHGVSVYRVSVHMILAGA